MKGSSTAPILEAGLRPAVHGFVGAEASVLCNLATELVDALFLLREEGVNLFPRTIITTDMPGLRRLLGSATHYFPFGAAKLTEVVPLALKRCGALSGAQWHLCFSGITSDAVEFGLIRSGADIISFSIAETLLAVDDDKSTHLAVHVSGKKVIELSRPGQHMRVEVSVRASDNSRVALDEFIEAFELKSEPLRTLLRKTLDSVADAQHGSLFAVAPPACDIGGLFRDGVVLPAPIDFAGIAREKLLQNDRESAIVIESIMDLIRQVALCDGITVVDSMGQLLAFRVFVSSPLPSAQAQDSRINTGGARYRAFLALREMVTQGKLCAAMYISQDGAILAARKGGPHE